MLDTAPGRGFRVFEHPEEHGGCLAEETGLFGQDRDKDILTASEHHDEFADEAHKKTKIYLLNGPLTTSDHAFRIL